MLRAQNCYSFIWGGAVRDSIIGEHPFDIDIGTTCEPERIKEVCIDLFGRHNCHSPHLLSQKLSIGRTNNNTKEVGSAKLRELYRLVTEKLSYNFLSYIYLLSTSAGAN